MPDEITGVTAQNDASTAVTGQEGAGEQGGEDNYKKRYEDSSTEAKRLFGEHQRALGELEALKSSLKNNNQDRQPQGFIPKEVFVKDLVDSGLPEEVANKMYLDRLQIHQGFGFLQAQNQALTNKQKFEEQERVKLQIESNPDIKRVVDFWKGTAMESYPVSEQKSLYDAKFKPTATGRDLSAVKGAAGSPVGGSSKGVTSFTSDQESEAQNSGFPSAQAMMDMSKCQTDADFKSWEAKYKKKS